MPTIAPQPEPVQAAPVPAKLSMAFDDGSLLADFTDAACDRFAYSATVPDPTSTLDKPLPQIPNPQSRDDFARNQLASLIVAQMSLVVNDFALRQARDAVLQAQQAKVNSSGLKVAVG